MLKSSSGKSVNLIILLTGFIFIAVALFIFVRTIKYETNGVKTDAVITDITTRYSGSDEEYDVYVEFYVEGVRYAGKLNSYESSFYEGKSIVIYYMPDNPNDFVHGSHNHLLAFLFFAFGGTAVAVIIFLTVSEKVKARRVKLCKKQGTEYVATVTGVEKSERFRVANFYTVTLLIENGDYLEKKMMLGKGKTLIEGDKVTVYKYGEGHDKFIVDFDSAKRPADNSDF